MKPIITMDEKELIVYERTLWYTYHNIPLEGSETSKENLQDITMCLSLIARCQLRRKVLRNTGNTI